MEPLEPPLDPPLHLSHALNNMQPNISWHYTESCGKHDKHAK